MRQFTIKRSGAQGLNFTGERLASAYKRYNHSKSIRYNLYHTIDGEFVCQKVYTKAASGSCDAEYSIHMATIIDTEDGVVEFFGIDTLARELYRNRRLS